MAQMNRDASYITVVDGLTPWEKLRNIRSFLSERRLALGTIKIKAKYDDLSKLTDKEKELRELYNEQSKGLLIDAENEINFLENLEKELIKITEPTRISGKNDREMYEINYYEELIQMHLIDIKADVISQGRVSPGTMKVLLRNPKTIVRAVKLGYIPEEMLKLPEVIRSENEIKLGVVYEQNKKLVIN